jgi:hypothetical protein
MLGQVKFLKIVLLFRIFGENHPKLMLNGNVYAEWLNEQIHEQIKKIYRGLGERTSGILKNEAIISGFSRREGEGEFGELPEGYAEEIPEGTSIENLANASGRGQKASAANIQISEDSNNLSRAIEKFNTPVKVSQYFDASYVKIRDK